MKKQRDQELRAVNLPVSLVSPPPTIGPMSLQLDDEGGVLPLLANLILYSAPPSGWQGVLGYDQFGAYVVIRKPPPWDAEAPDTPLTDHHETQTASGFRTSGSSPAWAMLAALCRPRPVAMPFTRCGIISMGSVWDGMPRLDTWLIKFFHADETPYIRAIGPRILIAAVARIYKPGCKVDHVPIFEGPQGKLKSEALRTITIRDEWFTDRLSHIGSKDAALETAGVFLVEIAEMEA